MDYNLKGKIEKWGMPVCNVIIQNPNDQSKVVAVNAVIDTGAYDYCISKKVIDILELPQFGKGGLNHPVEGAVETGIYQAVILFDGNIQPYKIMCKELVVVDYPVELIIGTSFLEGKSFAYNSSLRKWRIIW